MKPLVRAVLIPLTAAQMNGMIKTLRDNSNMDVKQAIEFIQESRNGECWKNDQYTVLKRVNDDGSIHLSIRRNDRAAARDWRDFQQIKNQMLGPEEEAVEIYPAESRVVDAANQYHLWSMPGKRIPFGFQTRFTSSESDPVSGFVQRPHSVDEVIIDDPCK